MTADGALPLSPDVLGLLEDALGELAGVFGRVGLDRGTLVLRDVPRVDDGGPATALDAYLGGLDISRDAVVGGVLTLTLAGADDLPRLQEGRAWITVGGVRQRDTGWPATWTVIALAGESADAAVAVDTAEPGCPVRGCAGTTYLPLADDLASWVRAVALVMHLEQARDGDVRDADLNLREDFSREVREALAPVLGAENLDGFMELHLD